MIPDRFAPVLDELQPLAARFEAAGHRLYLVGGTVRDLLVDTGRHDLDLDLTTDDTKLRAYILLQELSVISFAQGLLELMLLHCHDRWYSVTIRAFVCREVGMCSAMNCPKKGTRRLSNCGKKPSRRLLSV